jgi:GTPase involved in cell partitioning and DNA repair
MGRDPLIGLVGKPSAGKSTTLNSLTDASSKVGAFSRFPSITLAFEAYES